MNTARMIVNMVIRSSPPPAVSSPAHVVITALLGIVVTALCCYAFYIFRTSMSREQTFTDAMKVIRASTEIVSSLAEKGLPAIRGRVEELENRGRTLERNTGALATRLSSMMAGGSSTVTATTTTTAAPPTDAELLAARRAARGLGTQA